MEETLTLVEKTAFLKSMEALSTIPTEALADLASRAREIHYDAGDTIFTQGEANRGTFLIVEGAVVLRIGDAAVRVVRTGSAFGELFLAEGEPHTMTALAIEHTHALNITTDDVFDAMSDYPDFAASIVRGMSRQILALNSRVVELEGILSRFHAALVKAGIEPPANEPGPAPRGPEMAH
jgi:CRP-like cAMP-binding protein